ncbi:hypothetical protein PHOSAC3_120565 [Mesotoga infera]|nr:hypothetical protein PHOSAC3_120565 [Mesotoga infera]
MSIRFKCNESKSLYNQTNLCREPFGIRTTKSHSPYDVFTSIFVRHIEFIQIMGVLVFAERKTV